MSRFHGNLRAVSDGDITEVFNREQQDWLVANEMEIKSIIAGKGRIALDTRSQIELYNRRLKSMAAKKTATA